MTQLDAPDSLWPPTQTLQTSLPPTLKVLTPHATQLFVSSSALVPGPQYEQLTPPTIELTSPTLALQLTHPTPSDDIVPTAHSWHFSALVKLRLYSLPGEQL